MPTYDDANDNEALSILQSNFPDHKVIGLPSLGLITGGGSFHCVTQQQPIGDLHNE
jgi:agmatine deiminase